MPHNTPAPADPTLERRAKLFPLGRTVELLDGRQIEVRPWSLRTLVRITQRIPHALAAIQSAQVQADAPPLALLASLEGEAVFLLSESLGWKPEDVQELPAEDVLDLLVAVWDVCISGPAAKLQGLASRFGSLLATPEGDSDETPSPATTETR